MIAFDTEKLSADLQKRASQNAGRLVAARGVLTSTLEAGVGELCTLMPYQGSPVVAEVIGFNGGHTQLLSYQPVDGLRNGDLVTSTGHKLTIPVGEALRGRVIDGLGRPLDRGPSLERCERRQVLLDAPHALSR